MRQKPNLFSSGTFLNSICKLLGRNIELDKEKDLFRFYFVTPIYVLLLCLILVEILLVLLLIQIGII